MSLASGARLGPCEILAAIGKGGMGEVYRARDTKLDREVAIKVLPAALAQDPERLARFEREAKVLASLNHPNIAQIYGIEESSSLRALVMELVPGVTLKGPVPLDTALNYAKQIADALEAAHEKGITHRDLKPANIMLTPEGVVKVLDFGLASVPSREPGSDPANSPTLTMAATQAGTIMGTAAYMSPEQASGKVVDKRSDIWSFGVVLWEMLTGQQLFSGETISHTLADVLRAPIDFAKLPPATPLPVVELLKRCLDRYPRKRLRDIGEARFAIEKYLADPHIATEVPRPAEPRIKRLPWVVAAALAIAAAALGFVSYRHFTEETRVVKLSVLPPEKAALTNTLHAVSPDGRRLAFVAALDGKDSLWVRDLDSLAARPLPGTEGATYPFWSPDSHVIAFFAGGKLKKIDTSGGPALTLGDALNGRGGSWSKNGVIVFAPDLYVGLSRISAAGGIATPVTELDGASSENAHRMPWFLPDGRHFLFTARNNNREKNAVYVADLDSKYRKRILSASSNAVYVPPGYVLFQRDRTLMAQTFDAGKAQITADAVPIAEQVGYDALNLVGRFSVSQNGVLAYTAGDASFGDSQLTWFDRSGKAVGPIGKPGVVLRPAISPDGNTVAIDLLDPQTQFFDLWLHDLARGTFSRFTFNSKTNANPVWSPNGSHIAFASNRDGGSNVYQKASTGAAQDEAIDTAARIKLPDDWSRDGRYLIEEVYDPKTGIDIWVLPLFGDRKPFPYLQTEFNEHNAKLSPNGQWLAYVSDETKRNEVYVQTFPEPGGKWQVSTNGGNLPVWSRDGKELFFIGSDQEMMAVEVRNGPKFEAGVPKPLFDTRLLPVANVWFDVNKDGRFLIPTATAQSTSAPITVVLNWTAALKK